MLQNNYLKNEKMKKITTTLLLMMLSITGYSQDLSIGTNADLKLNIFNNTVFAVKGAATGNANYHRTLETTDWYMVSAPVSGQIYNNDYIDANKIASGAAVGTNRGIATYQTATNTWSYYQAGSADQTFATGIGYSVKRTEAGNISFTGTINTENVSVTVSKTGFNLLGNPYLTYLETVSFLNDNGSNLVAKDIWVWNKGIANYDVKNLIETIELAPGQAFFVKAKTAGNLTLKESYQQSTGNAFQKTSKSEVRLLFTDGTNNRIAKLFYLDNATTGYDNGYDGETFGGITNTTDIYTHLVTDDQGKKYQIQSLPNSDLENMVVPVGVTAAAGKEITFTAEALNLPMGLKVFLEDKLLNTMTRLDETNAAYKITLGEAANGIGRFYIHTKPNGVLSTQDIAQNNPSIYTLDKTTLRVVGIPQGKASVKLFNMLGKQVYATTFNAVGVNDFKLKILASGIYIVQLESDNKQFNKKIIIE